MAALLVQYVCTKQFHSSKERYNNHTTSRSSHFMPPTTFLRRQTRPVRVGDITIGGSHHVVVQSMITEETHNVPAAVEQIIAMHKAGAEIVRVTTPNLAEAKCLAEIKAELKKRYMDVPLVADV